LGQERLGILVERLFAARSGPPRTTALEPSAASFDEQALESHPRWAAGGSQGQVGRPAVTIRVPVDPGRRFAPASESLVAPCRREQASRNSECGSSRACPAPPLWRVLGSALLMALRCRRLGWQLPLGCRHTGDKTCVEQARLRVVGVFAQHQAVLHQSVDHILDLGVVLTE